MPGTTPLIGAPYGLAGDSISSILEADDFPLTVEKYVVQRYSSTATRDAALPVPEWGMVAAVGASAAARIVYFYNGATWQIIYQPHTWVATAIAQYSGSVDYCRRDNTGFVQLELSSTAAAGTGVSPTFITLPAGFRPSRNAIGGVLVNGTNSYRLLVSTAGAVQVLGMTIAVGNSLSGTLAFPIT